MLHIILLILKIIGFLILGILALILLLLGVILFVPVRYRAEASGEDTPESISADVKMSWFFHLITWKMTYKDGESFWKFRLAWKNFRSDAEDGGDDGESEESAGAENGADSRGNDAEKAAKKPEKNIEKGIEKDAEKDVEKDGVQEEAQQKRKKERAFLKEKNQSLIDRLKKFWGKIKYTFRKICANIKTLGEKKDKIVEFVEDRTHNSAFRRVLKELRRLLRALKPKEADIWFEFGFSDPALTGYTLALLSLIWPVVGEYTRFQPDFEHKVLKGKAYVKGKIRMIHFLVLAWNLFFDANVRKTYRDVRKFKL